MKWKRIKLLFVVVAAAAGAAIRTNEMNGKYDSHIYKVQYLHHQI